MKSTPKSTLPMSLGHLNDSLGYELPHAIAHIRAAMKAKDKASVKYNLKHAAGHTKDAMAHNKKLTKKLSKIPSVKRVLSELKSDRAKAGMGS